MLAGAFATVVVGYWLGSTWLGVLAAVIVGMLLAACGFLPPVAGAISQEVIDVFAVLNALRAAWPPRALTDYH